MIRLLCLLALLVSFPAHAAPGHHPFPGGIAVVPLGQDATPETVRFDGQRASLVRSGDQWQAVVGIPLDAEPGEHAVTVNRADGSLARHHFTIRAKDYPEEHITIKNKRKVTPSKSDLERIYRERDMKDNAMQTFRDPLPDLDLAWPVTGRISGEFGSRRFFNGKPRSPHSGIDVAAPRGTPIQAPADGRVILVNDFFFSGNCVYIEHGQGLITFYAHLAEPRVKKGQTVEKGQTIGLVGATGRVTGPHLHWGVALNRSWVDPRLLTPSMQAAR